MSWLASHRRTRPSLYLHGRQFCCLPTVGLKESVQLQSQIQKAKTFPGIHKYKIALLESLYYTPCKPSVQRVWRKGRDLSLFCTEACRGKSKNIKDTCWSSKSTAWMREKILIPFPTRVLQGEAESSMPSLKKIRSHTHTKDSCSFLSSPN